MVSYLGYTKPLPGATINWAHPLSRSLVACYMAQWGNILLRDLARGRSNDLSNNNGVSLVDTYGASQPDPTTVLATSGFQINPSANFVASSSQSLSAASTPDLQTGNIDWTIHFWIRAATLAGAQMVAAKVGTLNANREFQIYTPAPAADPSSLRMDWWLNATGSTATVTTPGNLINPGHWLIAFAWHDSQQNTINIQPYNPEIATDVGTISSVAASGGNAGAASFAIGKQSDLGGTTWNGLIDNVQIRKRLLTQDERTFLARNPYCFFNLPSNKFATMIPMAQAGSSIVIGSNNIF